MIICRCFVGLVAILFILFRVFFNLLLLLIFGFHSVCAVYIFTKLNLVNIYIKFRLKNLFCRYNFALFCQLCDLFLSRFNGNTFFMLTFGLHKMLKVQINYSSSFSW